MESKKVQPGDWLNSLSSAERKECAIAMGFDAYFPDAAALVARHSVRANEKHNPGQPVHWSRGKSNDHEDCVARHSRSIAVDPSSADGDGAFHIVCRAWRAMAALQIWIEERHAKGLPMDPENVVVGGLPPSWNPHDPSYKTCVTCIHHDLRSFDEPCQSCQRDKGRKIHYEAKP
jgi:hypothetical protein